MPAPASARSLAVRGTAAASSKVRAATTQEAFHNDTREACAIQAATPALRRGRRESRLGWRGCFLAETSSPCANFCWPFFLEPKRLAQVVLEAEGSSTNAADFSDQISIAVLRCLCWPRQIIPSLAQGNCLKGICFGSSHCPALPCRPEVLPTGPELAPSDDAR